MSSSRAEDMIRVAISPLPSVSRALIREGVATDLFAMSSRLIGLCGGRAIMFSSKQWGDFKGYSV
jgi:hypothetical protein